MIMFSWIYKQIHKFWVCRYTYLFNKYFKFLKIWWTFLMYKDKWIEFIKHESCKFIFQIHRQRARITYLETSHVTWIAGVLEAVLVTLEKELEEESASTEGTRVKRLTRCLTLFNAENLIRTRTWPESKAEYCISQSRAPFHSSLLFSISLD